MANRIIGGWEGSFLCRDITDENVLFLPSLSLFGEYPVKTAGYVVVYSINRITGKFILFCNSVSIFQEDQYIIGQAVAHAVNPETAMDHINYRGEAIEGEGS